MKAFVFKDDFKPQCPKNVEEDMEEIKDDLEEVKVYLKSKGVINIKYKSLDHLYRRFCDQEYSASWMSINSVILEEFAIWLSKIEVIHGYN